MAAAHGVDDEEHQDQAGRDDGRGPETGELGGDPPGQRAGGQGGEGQGAGGAVDPGQDLGGHHPLPGRHGDDVPDREAEARPAPGQRDGERRRGDREQQVDHAAEA